MRLLALSVLSFLVILPASGNARLPVVNIASGGISARAAFGEEPERKVAPQVAQQPAPTRTRKLVARSAKKVAPIQRATSNVNYASARDVLTPMRPSSNLWAQNEEPALRMPRSDEFAVIRSDSLLPEEYIDNTVAYDSVETAPIAEVEARLAALQKRAEDSIRMVSGDMPAQTQIAMVAPDANDDVVVRREIVPMEQNTDVIVRRVEKNVSPRIASVRDDMTKMSPAQLRQAFRKTFLSENQHLSTFSMDDSFDVVSDMTTTTGEFVTKRDLSEAGTDIRPLEIKIKFRNDDSALSRANYTLLTEYAGIVVNKPTRMIQVAIPQYMTMDADERKLAARRLAIVEQVLLDNGVPQTRIVPVLSQRDEQGFVLRMISSDQYDVLTQQSRDIFGDTVGKKTYKSMSW